MPNPTAANGAKNSTSFASNEFIVTPYAPCAIDAIKRYIWRVVYRSRRAILRNISTRSYAIQRRAERQRIEAQMHPAFEYIYRNR